MQKQAINLQDKRILVTGSPGFIGANLVMRLAREMGKRSLDFSCARNVILPSLGIGN